MNFNPNEGINFLNLPRKEMTELIIKKNKNTTRLYQNEMENLMVVRIYK
jgi:hypothetical protein